MVKTTTLAVGGFALATTLASASPILYERKNNGHSSGKKNIILGWTDGSKPKCRTNLLVSELLWRFYYLTRDPILSQWARMYFPWHDKFSNVSLALHFLGTRSSCLMLSCRYQVRQ